MADGQQAAFRSLLETAVPVTAYKRLSTVADLKAGDLVSGVSVRSERNSATDYIASLDFSFQADAVRSALSRQGIPYVDQQAPPVTVLTSCSRAIRQPPARYRPMAPRLDGPRPETHDHPDNDQGSEAGDPPRYGQPDARRRRQWLARAHGRIWNGLVVMAVAEPDMASKKLTVTLAGRDAAGPLLLKRTYRISDGDLDYASQLAAVVALGVIEGRWKAIKSAAPPASAGADMPVWAASTGGNGEDVTLQVEFSSSDQWDQMRAQLLDTPGVDGLNIADVTESSADYP